MQKFENHEGAPILCWANEIEDGAMGQARNLARLPFLFKHVALMPDVHEGYGMPIGGVIACKDVVIPNAVGVDIGCGMCAVETNRSVRRFSAEELLGLLTKIHSSIKRGIPVGFGVHNEEQEWPEFESFLLESTSAGEQPEPGWYTEERWERAKKSLGTLGGGNHFIEIQKTADEDGTIWLMLHSGSRNLGKVIADYYHSAALEMCKKWHSNLPHENLAFLPVDSYLGQCYLRDMNFALEFAHESRQRMMAEVKRNFAYYMGENTKFPNEFNIHHNYANLENHMGSNVWVHRKGATSARKEQVGIIPGSMGTPSYIVLGKGNPLSFMSCSHGAGRRMGRAEASRILKEGDCWADMGGVVFDGWGKNRKGDVDLGEAPAAYKNIDDVIENQRDLVDICEKLLPLAVIKG